MPTKYEAYCPLCYEKAVFDSPRDAGEWIEEHIKNKHRAEYLSWKGIMPSAKILVAKATTKIDERTDSASYTYAAGEELTHLSITAEGSATITFEGDGSADIEMRVYADGVLVQTVTANQPAIITVGFTTSLEIRSYAAAAVTANYSSFHVAGWRFA